MSERKSIRFMSIILMVVALLLFLPCLSIAGSLEPSDPPGPTMYTLEEIHEAVTPLPTGFELWPNNTRFAVSNEGTPDVNSDDVVLDRATGLMWTRDANLGGLKNWQDAVNYCNFFGPDFGRRYTFALDWRLPSIEEFTSLSEPYPSVRHPALPAGHPFENVQSGNYWSSTTFTSSAAFVGMLDGLVYDLNMTSDMYVWCVRGGQGLAPQ
ncbi:MAG: DUF1566 domain-containing protein [Nitrospirota bacterium]